MTDSNDKKFDIIIGILGCESTGKSTVLNTLCGGEYTEAKYGRTTEGINMFRLVEAVGPSNLPTKDTILRDPGVKRPLVSSGESEPTSKRLRSMATSLSTIKENNEVLRQADRRGEVSSVNLTVDKLPIKMRDDAHLVIMESPGLNAGRKGNEAARAYVETNWHKLDAAVLVMDARKSVDYDDQMENLVLLHRLCTTKKDIPIFILCNKVWTLFSRVIELVRITSLIYSCFFLCQVDDPDNLGPEEEDKLKDVRGEVEKIWGVGCRKQALEQLLSVGCSKYEQVFPVFAPVSAKTAFLVRAGSSMSKEEFKEMKLEYFHCTGQQEFGKKDWKKMSDMNTQHDAVYDRLLNNEEQRADLLRMSGFDKFLKALDKCVGGEQAQLSFIRKNYHREIKALNLSDGDILPKLRSMNNQRLTLGEAADSLKDKVSR